MTTNQKFRALFAWHAVRRVGVWVLLENKVTGQRSAYWSGSCYGPLCDEGFLRKGDVVYGPTGRYVIGSESELWCG